MDLKAAYEVLGLSESADLDQVRTAYRHLARKYHPDVQGSGDSQKFILLGAAYSLIYDALTHKQGQQVPSESSVPEEVVVASGISQQLDDRFRQIEKDYQDFRDRLVSSTETYLFQRIASASSGSNLKHLVEHSIGQTWSEMVKQLENYVGSLISSAADDDREFLNLLFRDLYDARREYWIHSLYHNPVVIVGVLGTVLLGVTSHLPAVSAVNPWLTAIKDTPWIQFLPLQATVLYGSLKLWALNPRSQFVPPRLSVAGVHAEVREIASGIGQSLGESTAGGATAGLLAGAYLAHPLIGLAVGGLMGILSGENLDSMKDRVTNDLKQRLEFGVQQLNDRILAWIHRQKIDIVAQAKESFANNFLRVKKLLIENRQLGNRLAISSRLLLQGPASAPVTEGSRQVPVHVPAASAKLPATVPSPAPSGRQRASSAKGSSVSAPPSSSRISTALAAFAIFAFGAPVLLTLAKLAFPIPSDPVNRATQVSQPQLGASAPGAAGTRRELSPRAGSNAPQPSSSERMQQVVPNSAEHGPSQSAITQRSTAVPQPRQGRPPQNPGDRSAPPQNTPMMGWSEDQVLSAFGQPDSRSGSMWWYGNMGLVFQDGHLIATTGRNRRKRR